MDAEPLTPIQRRLAAKYPPLTDYFFWINDVDPGRVVIFARESTHHQDRDGNLRWQRSYYRRRSRDMGFDVLRTFGEIGSGYNYSRPTLAEACAHARRHDAIVLAEAVNRYLRPIGYTSQNSDELYPLEELQRIKEIAGGVMLCTFFHPATPEHEVRGHQTKRGLMKPPQRGSTKVRNDRLRDTVLDLFANGCTRRQISRQTSVPLMTVSRWIASSAL